MPKAVLKNALSAMEAMLMVMTHNIVLLSVLLSFPFNLFSHCNYYNFIV